MYRLNNTIIIFTVILFSSCKRDPITCEQTKLSYLIALVDTVSCYRPKDALLEVYNARTQFDSLILKKSMRSLFDVNPERKHDIVINFDIREGLSSANAYRLILDDSLVYDISDIKLWNDTMGMTMSQWAIRCSLDSFRVNGRMIKSVNNDVLEFPLQMHKLIKDDKKMMP